MGLRDCRFKISYGPDDDRLHGFYIPALRQSVRYDRSAGFFSSTALAVAAAGVAHLIAVGGRMRLLVGAALDPADIEAVRRGEELRDRLEVKFLALLGDPGRIADFLLRRRLEALAWMVAAGTLEIRVVIPKGPDGLPLPAAQAQEYYHPKEGLFTDALGDRVAFSGSVNESAAGWLHNYEQFSVYCSWDASRPYLLAVADRFERLWSGREPRWLALDLPQAVRDRLVALKPAVPPAEDPLEEPGRLREIPGTYRVELPDEEAERVLFSFLRDAPLLPNGQTVGLATAAVRPWPHQVRVAENLVATFPQSYLLCDEVGLGKTVEAGLALRQLVLDGRVKRCLILVPKSLLHQWQEELQEKLLLRVPIFDGQRFLDVGGQSRMPRTENPWQEEPILLASSQLAKQVHRREELLRAGPWDLVVVDEAHHARRREFASSRYRPNRLLELLTALREQTGCLWLLTATPMQVNPVEVWDLLKLLGVGGRWGVAENFVRYFAELRRPFDMVDWPLVISLLREHLETEGDIDGRFAAAAERRLGAVEWERVRSVVAALDPARQVKTLSPAAQAVLTEMARRHTPLATRLFRSTRQLLRRYRASGLLKDTVPERRPSPVWIPMTEQERRLYERIEEYVSEFYQKYEAERRGLGFVMTVYRRRLTSSFYAVQESLKRRLEFLAGRLESPFDDDDLEAEDLKRDVSEELADADRARFLEEMSYIRNFLREIGELETDSKFARLCGELDRIFQERDSVIIFTQYTDTMDYLRDRLKEPYGARLACYSGRGGERWDGSVWVPVPKEQVRNGFADGNIRILLCTRAASEGLNLQTCGVLINYDMPWNPMEVEQRIGRIDRIGQRYPVVWIYNYFYEDTVEALVYLRLADRIRWFETVVGELQPILGRVEEVIERVAMTPAAERAALLEEEVAALRRDVETAEAASLRLEELAQSPEPSSVPEAPVTLDDIRGVLLEAKATRHLFAAHPTVDGAYLLRWRGKDLAVTFSPEVYDAYASELHLLTYGDDVFDALVREHASPCTLPWRNVVRFSGGDPAYLCAYYHLSDGARRVSGLSELRDLLRREADAGSADDHRLRDLMAAAERDFQELLARKRKTREVLLRQRLFSNLKTLEETARHVLCRAALAAVLLEKGETDCDVEEDQVALLLSGMNRLRHLGYPFAPLLRLVGTGWESTHRVAPEHFRDRSKRHFARELENCRHEAGELVRRIVEMRREWSEKVEGR